MLSEMNEDGLRDIFLAATPFPHIIFDSLIETNAAESIADSFPDFSEAERIGAGFETVNEHRKIQITDYDRFPKPVQRLADVLASSSFLNKLETMTGIPNLIWDEQLVGGGMHQTASTGVLDVHVDFNLLRERKLYRRLNLLIYLNSEWNDEWGGALELWDRDVQQCARRVMPSLGRAVLFETSEISYHGVTAVTCPEGTARKSFAAYYYTKEPPPSFAGKFHSTRFKARPHEYQKKYVLMPMEALRRGVDTVVQDAKQRVKKRLGL